VADVNCMTKSKMDKVFRRDARFADAYQPIGVSETSKITKCATQSGVIFHHRRIYISLIRWSIRRKSFEVLSSFIVAVRRVTTGRACDTGEITPEIWSEDNSELPFVKQYQNLHSKNVPADVDRKRQNTMEQQNVTKQDNADQYPNWNRGT
jgi:hypothetical protein